MHKAVPGERDMKSIMARINKSGWKQLRMLSVEKEMPLEDMIIESLNGFLGMNGKPAIIEKRTPAGLPANRAG